MADSLQHGMAYFLSTFSRSLRSHTHTHTHVETDLTDSSPSWYLTSCHARVGPSRRRIPLFVYFSRSLSSHTHTHARTPGRTSPIHRRRPVVTSSSARPRCDLVASTRRSIHATSRHNPHQPPTRHPKSLNRRHSPCSFSVRNTSNPSLCLKLICECHRDPYPILTAPPKLYPSSYNFSNTLPFPSRTSPCSFSVHKPSNHVSEFNHECHRDPHEIPTYNFSAVYLRSALSLHL